MYLEDSLRLIGSLNQKDSDNTRLCFTKTSPVKIGLDKELLNACYFRLSNFENGIEKKQIDNSLKKKNQQRTNKSKKDLEEFQLPKIKYQKEIHSHIQKIDSIITKHPKNDISSISSIRRQNSENKLNSSLLQISQWYDSLNCGKQNQIDKLKDKKKGQLKKIIHQPLAKLNTQQRYFQISPFKISDETMIKMGYYQATNLFKRNNVEDHLKSLEIKAKKPENNLLKIIKKNDLFVTDLSSADADFSMDEFIRKQMEYNYRHKLDSIQSQQKQYLLIDELTPEQVNLNVSLGDEPIIKSQIYLTIKDFEVQKDKFYFIFKKEMINFWGDALLIFKQLSDFFKSRKINYFKIQASKINFWSGKKITFETIRKSLNLERMFRPTEIVQKICLAFKDKLKVRAIREDIDKKANLARWAASRFLMFAKVRQQRRKKIKRAYELHEQLEKDMSWQVEIFLPSFSVSEFQRNTTQYMECFESLFHPMWQQSQKPLILILPTVNEEILTIFQSRLKINRKVSIICPQVHHTFPPNLPLTAHLLYSYATLQKVKQALANRKAVITSGRFQNPQYQLLLSQYLNIPLLASLKINRTIKQEKQLFNMAGVQLPISCIIEAGCSQENLLTTFAKVLIDYPQEKKWILKLNYQFNGRGISTFKFTAGRYTNRGETRQKKLEILRQQLRVSLRLKLKVNFQNSLFMVEDFIQQIMKKGGVIEEELSTTSFFQLCYTKYQYCNFNYAFNVYATDYCNRVWTSVSNLTAGFMTTISSIQNELERQPYYGHISVTIAYKSGKCFGIDVKPYQTYTSGITSLISLIQERRRLLDFGESQNLTQIPTKRYPEFQDNSKGKEGVSFQLQFGKFHYLVIPRIVFPDVQEVTKAKMIEDLMRQIWKDRHFKINDQCVMYFSVGLDLSLLLVGKEMRRLKKRSIECIRVLAQKIGSLKQYRGKQVTRDVFQFGDLIRAISQIHSD